MLKDKDKSMLCAYVSMDAALRLDEISKTINRRKADLVNEAIIVCGTDPNACPYNIYMEIGEQKRPINIVLPDSTRDLLKQNKSRGIMIARFLNALLLNYPWKESPAAESHLPDHLPDDDLLEDDFSEDDLSVISSEKKDELFSRLDTLIMDANNLLNVFIDKQM